MSLLQKRKSGAVDMCQGPILLQIIKFTVPLLISGFLQVFFNAADIMIVGKFGSEQSLAAVSSTGSIIALLVNLFIGLSVGTNVLCARFFGAKDHKNMEKAIHTSVLLSLIVGIAVGAFGFFASEYLLRLINTPSDIISLASLYLKIYFLAIPATLIINFTGAILRAVGDTKRPMYYLLIAGVINVVFNMVFVIVFKLDVAGVAIATVISQIIAAALSVRCLIRESGSLKLNLRLLKIDRVIFFKIIQIGLPAGLQSSMFAISNVFIQSGLNSFDNSLLLAGNGAAANIEGFLFTATSSIHQSIVSFTGQNYGRRNYKRIVGAQIYGCLFAFVFCFILCFFVNYLSPVLLTFYSDSQVEIAYGVTRIGIVGTSVFIFSLSEVFVGGMRGMGYSISNMIVSLICTCGFRLLWIATVFQKFHTLEVLLYCYPVSYVLSVIVQGIFLLIVLRIQKKRLTSPIENIDSV